MTPEQIWRGKRDGELVDAAGRLHDYFEEGQWAILSEMARRGLRMPDGELPRVPERPVAAAPAAAEPSGEGPQAPAAARPVAPRPPFWPPGVVIPALWRGEFSLPITYWGFAQLGGLVLAVPQLGLRVLKLNAVADVLDGVALAYSVVVIVGIWRSAARYGGHPFWAHLARAATVLPPIIALITLAAQR
ncbi:MAG: hypothetical protein AB7I25_05040 [Vicinamibacterales bacterium]